MRICYRERRGSILFTAISLFNLQGSGPEGVGLIWGPHYCEKGQPSHLACSTCSFAEWGRGLLGGLQGPDYFEKQEADDDECEEATGNEGATWTRQGPLLCCSVSASCVRATSVQGGGTSQHGGILPLCSLGRGGRRRQRVELMLHYPLPKREAGRQLQACCAGAGAGSGMCPFLHMLMWAGRRRHCQSSCHELCMQVVQPHCTGGVTLQQPLPCAVLCWSGGGSAGPDACH